jgi:signal transduction histidine kinase
MATLAETAARSRVSRVNQAINVLSQVTVEAFVSLYTETISEQNERLEQFTRMAAHEWRQPLGGLQFGMALLRRRDLDAEGTERTWATVERNLQHLVELTRKLEAVARMQDGGDGPMVQEVSAGAIAQEAARQLRESADARGVRIVIPDDLPRLVADVGRLELVFINLLSNAIKYSDPEKPDRHVTVSGCVDGDGWCRIEVRDNGIGIPAAALPRVFQRFTRVHADRADTSHVSGVGLGLSITEDCVRAMDGRIDVQSVEREGSVFIVSLPRASEGS